MNFNFSILPKAKYLYIEYRDGSCFVWFSNIKYRGFVEIEKEDLDEECDLSILGYKKVVLKVENLFDKIHRML